MIIRQTTTIVFEYPQDYLQEQEWCKTKDDRWIHKSTDTICAVYENTISYNIGQPSDSEKPNNCEHITEDGVTCAKYPACGDCLDNPLNKVKGSERLVKGSEQTDLVEDSPSLVKDLVKAFGEDGTWLERQGVYTLTLAEAKQRAVDIIESVLAKDEPTSSKLEQVEDEQIASKLTDIGNSMVSAVASTMEQLKSKLEDEPQTSCKTCRYGEVDEGYVRCAYYSKSAEQDEPQTEPLHTCSVNGRPYSECSSCEHFKCTADEPQTDCAWR